LGTTPPSRPAAAAGKRLAWLDALRGIAALCVVFDHLTYSVFQPVRDSVYHWFDPGQYGVFVFFLVSGYIVPASLERRGSVRGFWASRAFRLYPLYLFALGAMVVLWAGGLGSLSGMDSNAVTSSFADVFMLQSVLWAPTVPNVVWSLAYEMVFYLMITALFLAGVHRRSGRHALVFAAAAVGLGGVFVPGFLSHQLLSPGVVVAITDSLVLAGLALTLAGRGRTRTAGAALAAATGLLLIEVYASVPWTRNQNFVPIKLFLVTVFVTVLLVCCGLTHRYIEAPMQRVGRRVAARLDARFGPDVLRPRRPRLDPSAEPALGDAAPQLWR
jgi:peptidoglycan/LPS O-acetylase OafA/YrhL